MQEWMKERKKTPPAPSRLLFVHAALIQYSNVCYSQRLHLKWFIVMNRNHHKSRIPSNNAHLWAAQKIIIFIDARLFHCSSIVSDDRASLRRSCCRRCGCTAHCTLMISLHKLVVIRRCTHEHIWTNIHIYCFEFKICSFKFVLIECVFLLTEVRT